MESRLVEGTGIHVHTVTIVSCSLGQSLIMLRGERNREGKKGCYQIGGRF